jgi:hypothetical protein
MAKVIATVKQIIDQVVTEPPIAKSLGDTLHKDGSFTYDNTTDSQEAIADAIAALDTAVSVTGATTAGTIVGDATGGTPDIVTVASSASANTFGSAIAVDASLSADSWISGFTVNSANIGSNKDMVFEIREDAVTKVRISKFFVQASGVGWNYGMTFMLPIPILFSAGTALTFRIADSVASADSYEVGVNYYQGLET